MCCKYLSGTFILANEFVSDFKKRRVDDIMAVITGKKKDTSNENAEAADDEEKLDFMVRKIILYISTLSNIN